MTTPCCSKGVSSGVVSMLVGCFVLKGGGGVCACVCVCEGGEVSCCVCMCVQLLV